MTVPNTVPGKPERARPSFFARLRRETHGTAAIELAMTLIPFATLVTGITGCGLYFLTNNVLAHAAEIASRSVRTGLAQVGNPNANPAVNPQTNADFLNAVCTNAVGVLNCDSSHLVVHVQNWANWANIQPAACTDIAGNMTPPTGASTDLLSLYTGGASQVVLITVCYKWDLATTFPLLPLPRVMQGAAAFRSEPFN